jgi:hypothetical protein
MLLTADILWTVHALARTVAHGERGEAVVAALGDLAFDIGDLALEPACLAAPCLDSTVAVILRRAADMASITREARADRAVMEKISAIWRAASEAEDTARARHTTMRVAA